MLIRGLVCSLLLTSFGATAYAGPKQKTNVHKLAVDEFFTQTEGTFILRDLKNGETFVYNEQRANEQLTPESKYK